MKGPRERFERTWPTDAPAPGTTSGCRSVARAARRARRGAARRARGARADAPLRHPAPLPPLALQLQQEWTVDNEHRRAAAVALAERQLGECMRKEDAARKAAKAEGLRRAEELRAAADLKETQAVLRIMRRAGTIAGVNSKPPEEPGTQRETDTRVRLRVRGDNPTGEMRRKRNYTHFEVDLRRFRNVETMTGDAVGAVGARYLAKDLTLGVCPRLSVMDPRGTHRAAGATRREASPRATPHLVTLRLKANDLPPPSTKGLADALVAAACPRCRSSTCARTCSARGPRLATPRSRGGWRARSAACCGRTRSARSACARLPGAPARHGERARRRAVHAPSSSSYRSPSTRPTPGRRPEAEAATPAPRM